MSTVQFYNGNGGVYGYSAFREYEITSNTNARITMHYNDDFGTFDAGSTPFRIVFNLSDAESHIAEDGPHIGERIYTAGSIETIRFLSEDGDLQVRITDIDVPLTWFQPFSFAGNLGDFYDLLIASGTTFIGAHNGPASSWNTFEDSDNIQTGIGDDIVTASGGNDFIKDRGGADTYDGGAGEFDTLSYQDWFWNPLGTTSGIVADLAAGTITGPDGALDTVTRIENIYGTFRDDIILGDNNGNYIRGLGGADTLNGRGGHDTVSYRRDIDHGGTDGIRANLQDGTVRDGFGQMDTILNFEHIEGTKFRDVFIDGSGNYNFEGAGGNDIFRMRGGNDTATGGSGADTFIFLGTNFGNDFISDFKGAQGDLIEIRAASSFGDLAIFENSEGHATIEFGSGFVTLQGVSVSDLSASDFIF